MEEDNREACRRQIMSQDYGDFIVEYANTQGLLPTIENDCSLTMGSRFVCIYAPKEQWEPLNYEKVPYDVIPKLFALQDTDALTESGITQVQQSALGLTGKGVLLGIMDTGIDYTHPAFLNSQGKTRIAAIWDQTIEDGPMPVYFPYGSEYRSEQIDEALKNPEKRYEIVPSIDEDGHGTFLAGVAAGSPGTDFTGAAPEATIAVVKCKPAKNYLRDFFAIKEGAVAFQENDIMLAAAYLEKLREELHMPLVILCGMGTNYGSHAGTSRLSEYLSTLMNQPGISCVVPTGNETGLAHHYQGKLSAEKEYQDVEIRVDQGERGFQLELWTQVPDRLAVSLISPAGDSVPQVPLRRGQSQRVEFLLERTTVDVSYRFLEARAGGHLVILRFLTPAPGIWTVRVYAINYLTGIFHMWLPVEEFLQEGTVFLNPSPDTTLTVPSAAENLLTVAAYDPGTGGIEIHSGRGFTRTGGIKPDLAAPGVGVYGPVPGGRYSYRTGTSTAAAIAAGASACLLEWGVIQGNRIWINNNGLRAALIQGAVRNPNLEYPGKEWGYGKLNLYQTITNLY
jgi:subtilisin family serine protease